MRPVSGTKGNLRASALWGKKTKGEARGSALWGKPGRGFAALLTAVVALSVPVAAPAADSNPGQGALVPDALLAGAQAHPNRVYRVIVQAKPGKASREVARAVNGVVAKHPGKAMGLKRQFSAVAGVAASLTGRQLVDLAKQKGILAITGDRKVAATGQFSNDQGWVQTAGVDDFWSGNQLSGVTLPAIAIVDSGVQSSRMDFYGRVIKQVRIATTVAYAPGNDPFVITVGASDLNNTPSTAADDYAAPWSAFGYTLDGFAKPDIGAPGRLLIGPVPAASSMVREHPERVTATGYMWMSGTSFAAPVVSGTAALVLGFHPNWTPDQVKGALLLTAQPTAAGMALGVGEVNAKAATQVSSPPNPNLALDQFVGSDGAGGLTFDSASWASTAAANASWNSASWNEASWSSASWANASWNSASWAAASWNSASWAAASWNSASWAAASWAAASWAAASW